MSNNSFINLYLAEKKQIIDNALINYLPAPHENESQITQAMRYSVAAGGKRLRPILTLSAFSIFCSNESLILPTACAVEFVHSYSLIHDDLPAMDDDDLRRGMPTCHVKFGEALAILAGDALLTYSFELLSCSRNQFPTDLKIRAIEELAKACGYSGMILGQELDLENQNKLMTINDLENIHNKKTGTLLAVSVMLGAMMGGASPKVTATLEQYGKKIGLAFQIVDDILDVTGKKEIIGKPVGEDRAHGKTNYPSLLGVDESKKLSRRLVESAKEELRMASLKSRVLEDLADFVVDRIT